MGLQSELNRIASSFTQAVFQAIREVSLEELLAETGGLRGMEYGPDLRRSLRSQGTAGRERSSRRAGRAMGPSERAAARGMGGRAARGGESEMPGRRTRRARRGPTGRLKRRSGEDIKKALSQIVSLVGQHPKGMRAEEIRSELGMEAREMPRILGEGLASRKLKKRGHKRATTYYAS